MERPWHQGFPLHFKLFISNTAIILSKESREQQ